MAQDRIQTYAEFWPFYVCEHSQPLNRALHFVGTTLAMLLLGSLIYTRQWWFLPLVLLLGYGPAWVGHFKIEHNRPATFEYPLWSLVSDYRMWWLMATGRMGDELKKASAIARAR